MKESYEEDVANHFGLQRRGDCGNNVVLSVRAEGQAGQLLSSEITILACRPCPGQIKGVRTHWRDVRRVLYFPACSGLNEPTESIMPW
jgi:hypothetical protein